MANNNQQVINDGTAHNYSVQNQVTNGPAGQMYLDPQGLRGQPVNSSVDPTKVTEEMFYTTKILPETAKKRKFSRMASTISMPKNRGRKIKAEVAIRLLDDRNLNDQGIDARGAYTVNGNLYGSSKDIGKITGALPRLTEEGGRVNRVGFSRAYMEGTFNEFGMFIEYSRTLEELDQNPNLIAEQYKELLMAAEQVVEHTLQIDLLNGAGTIVYAGNAVSDETMNETSLLTWKTLSTLNRALDENKTPKETKYIFGSTNVDTKTATIDRIMFAGREVIELLKTIRHPISGQQAFIEPHQYGAGLGGKLMEDEAGIIGGFRVIYVDDMVFWEGAGANADPAFGLASSGGKYNIYPALAVGDDAFTCISFNGSNGINNKFETIHKKPGREMATKQDPYGRFGFISIQWHYGVLIKRPERLGLVKTVAPM